MLHIIEWTHDDGMDEHQEIADLDDEQALEIARLLNDLGAVNGFVYRAVETAGFESLKAVIRDDLEG